MMDTQPPTYMLLPNFGYIPDKDVYLGTLLLLSNETKLPDPDLPLNEHDRVVPSEADVRRYTEKSWKFDRANQRCWSAGLDAEVPLFAPAGGDIGYGTDNDQELTIECDRLDTQRFVPNRSYLARSLANDFVRDYCRKHWFPSVYLVTGMKVAHNASISRTDGRKLTGNIKAHVDTTALGVPLKVGPSTEASDATTKGVSQTVEGPFLLAYELKRLKVKRDSSLNSTQSFNKFALFSDMAEEDTAGTLLDECEIENVVPNTAHDV